MSSKNLNLILFCLILAGLTLVIIYPKAVQAEIATTTDWIGLFATGPGGTTTSGTTCAACPAPTYTSCDCKQGTVNGNIWAYTSSCTQTPGSTPKLDSTGSPGPCNFIVNPIPSPGTYEYRMYANDKEDSDSLLSAVTFTSLAVPSPSPLPVPITGKVYNIEGDFTVNSNIPVTTITGIVFVKGNLTINTDISNTSGTSGLVFVVKGNIIINPAVIRIDAVLISSSHIYTAGSGCSHLNPVTASQLVVNGSLISLNQDPGTNIEFCRSLAGTANSTTPAEVVNQQPKYPVILRNLYSDTLQKWTEIQ